MGHSFSNLHQAKCLCHASYWTAVSLTLEPRLSSKWIANISLFGSIISLPIPKSSFVLSSSTGDTTTLYHPTPPPLSTIIENILPSSGNMKVNFSKGLQQSTTTHGQTQTQAYGPGQGGLVQHCTALALAKCLLKYRAVLHQFRDIAGALEENANDETGREGQWSRRARELRKELRKRVPDFQVIIAFAQQKAVNRTKAALLAESANRLLWLYHCCLPEVVAEARFDVGKLLMTLADPTSTTDSSEENGEDKGETTAPRKLHAVSQLHVYRLLESSDQFVWSGKPRMLSSLL